MINIAITRTMKPTTRLHGDPVDIAPVVTKEVQDAIYRGDEIHIVVTGGRFDWCAKCEAATANHEPRRNQPTRKSRGYYSCPVCGYVKEGVLP